MASLETTVLEGRAVLASTQADRDGIAMELTAAREACVQTGELKAEAVKAHVREEGFRVEIDRINNDLQVGRMFRVIATLYKTRSGGSS